MPKRFIIGLLLLLIVLVPLVGCSESATKAAFTQPAPQSAKTTSTADLQKQIDQLSQRVKSFENQLSGKYSFGGDLESRVSALENRVGGRYSLGGSLSDLESRVSALERKVGGQYSIGGGSLSSLESSVSELSRRVSALESKSRW